MPKFRNIPQFTRDGNYRVDVSWEYLEEQLRQWHHPEAGETLDMDPDFQRGHVWTEEQQIRYCEFVLRGGVGGNVIYWNNPSWGKGYDQPTQLVDGKQRITAVLRFLRNEIPVFGYFRRDYTDRTDIIRTRFTFVVNDLKTRREVLQWYLDLNTGGTIHTSDEIEKVQRLLAAEVKGS
jgi:hypothetical protein